MKTRADIYGLCALCLFGVLSNQIWPYYIFNGFYGLDVFFLVVGYETYRRLVLIRLSNSSPSSSSTTTTTTTISNLILYQLRKLLPIYLTVCGLVIFACIFLVSPSEFPKLIRQTKEAIFFVSNINFEYQDVEYFPTTLSHRPFEHIWPISLIVQYALFVAYPAFLIYQNISNGRFLLVVAVSTTLSFIYYQLMEEDSPKNLLDRGWQFGLGFLAFAVAHRNRQKFDDGRRPFHWKSTLLTSLVLLSLVVPLPINSQIHRPVSTFIGFSILIVGSKKPCFLLDSEVFKLVGRIGFVVYVWFWPLFTLYNYCFGVHRYIKETEGLVLLLIICVIGYLIECFMERCLEIVDSWWKVFCLVGLGYLFVFAMLRCMVGRRIVPYKSPLSLEMQGETRNLLARLYQTHNHEQILDDRQAMRYNSLIFAYSHNQHSCAVRQRRLFIDRFYYFDFVCLDKGTGNKTMMIIGDSGAKDLLHGVRYHFRNIYSQLILISSDSCVPFLSDRLGFGERKCLDFSQDVRSVISKWPGKVDLVVFHYKYPDGREPPIRELQSDKYYLVIDEFYQFVSQHVREWVFVPAVSLTFNIPPLIPYIQDRLFFRLDLNIFSIPIEYHRRCLGSVQTRIEHIKCLKCLKVDMSQIFCSPLNSVCYAMDFHRKLTYFKDESRLNALGSLFYAEYLVSLMKNESGSSPIFNT